MQFWLHPNPRSAEALSLAETLSHQLAGRLAETPQRADIVIVLGGDGTLLRAVRALHALSKPFWVVNCGHLGYLSDCEREGALAALDKILRGAYRLEYRTQLGGVLQDGSRVTALNELLLHRGSCVHTLRMQVLVNGSLALRYRGDGLILCTASGSTAYNLSAGGPVLMPEMELMALTPICPQALSAVPIVVSAHDAVEVSWRMSLREDQNEWPDLTVDGLEKRRLPLEGVLRLGESLPRVGLVRTQDARFYGRLQQRMRWSAE